MIISLIYMYYIPKGSLHNSALYLLYNNWHKLKMHFNKFEVLSNFTKCHSGQANAKIAARLPVINQNLIKTIKMYVYIEFYRQQIWLILVLQ